MSKINKQAEEDWLPRNLKQQNAKAKRNETKTDTRLKRLTVPGLWSRSVIPVLGKWRLKDKSSRLASAIEYV